jgi:hypothetical protein
MIKKEKEEEETRRKHVEVQKYQAMIKRFIDQHEQII